MTSKVSYFLIAFFLSIFLVSYSNIQAQEGNIIQVKSEPIELYADKMYIPCEDPANPACEAYPENTAHPDPANPDHELLIANEELPANTDFYIVGCINSGTGIHCTTGVEQLDEMLNSLPGGDTMIPDPSYQFKSLTNPVKTDENGNLSVIVRSFSPQVTSHIFNAYYIVDQDLLPTTIAIQPSGAPEQSLHLQSFEQVTPQASSVGTRIPRRRQRPRGQRFVDWDPKGRTFDIKSLEPITEVEVSLLNNFKDLFVYKSIINPQIVQANGEFNFWVPNGIYYLQFAKLPETHSWPIAMDQVHPNYSLAYFCDPEVKDNENMPVPLYYDQFSIIEFNKLVHCDVPLDPGTNPPIKTPVRTIDYGLVKNSLDGSFTFSGKVSHPFTKVQLMAQSTERIVQEIEADKLGFWRTTLLPGSYPLTTEGIPDKIMIRYIKKDLTATQIYEPVGGLTLDPILNYIEGYAYDSNGQILSNARVGIKQKGSDKIIYLTVADDQGYFKIGSQYLPSLPYDLVFSLDKTNVIVTSSQFLTSNQSYFQTKDLNLVLDNNNSVPLTTVAISSFKAIKSGESLDGNSSIPTEEIKTKKSGSSANLVIILLLILIATGLVIFKLKKNRNITTETSL